MERTSGYIPYGWDTLVVPSGQTKRCNQLKKNSLSIAMSPFE